MRQQQKQRAVEIVEDSANIETHRLAVEWAERVIGSCAGVRDIPDTMESAAARAERNAKAITDKIGSGFFAAVQKQPYGDAYIAGLRKRADLLTKGAAAIRAAMDTIKEGGCGAAEDSFGEMVWREAVCGGRDEPQNHAQNMRIATLADYRSRSGIDFDRAWGLVAGWRWIAKSSGGRLLAMLKTDGDKGKGVEVFTIDNGRNDPRPHEALVGKLTADEVGILSSWSDYGRPVMARKWTNMAECPSEATTAKIAALLNIPSAEAGQ